MMKITQVISDSGVGGAGILLASVAEGLAHDFRIEIILPEGSQLTSRIKSSDVKITEAPMKADSSFSISDALGFYRYFSKNRPDVLHTHASLSARLGGALAGIRPCISTRHCATPRELVKRAGFIKRSLYGYCTDLTVSTADYATENLLAEGYNPKKIVTIKNGVKKLWRSSEEEIAALRQSLAIPDDALIIGCCARLEAVKGQDLILRAARILKEKLSNVFYLFVGDGSKKDELKRTAAAYGILPLVKFVGYVPNPEIYQNLFYVNVNASRGTETSCLSSSECMSLGIPSVVSDFGGNTEMFENLKNGIVFRSDDALALANALFDIITDKTLYKTLSEGAFSIYSRSFSAERMVEDYRRLYREAYRRCKIERL